jgi:hypothetical protein
MAALPGLNGLDPHTSGVRTTSSATVTTTTLLTTKLTVALTLCALVALLASAFIGRGGARQRALDAGPGEDTALATSSLAEGSDGAVRREAQLDGASADIAAASDAEPNGASIATNAVTIVARATTHDGQPIRGARLSLALAEQHVARGADDGRLALSLDRALLEQVAGVVEQRSVMFWVGARDFGSRNVAAVFAEDANRIVLGDVVLQPGGAVHGRLVDPEGLGVEGALVVFSPPPPGDLDLPDRARIGPVNVSDLLRGARALSTRSDAGGAFRLNGVPVGFGLVWARTTTSAWACSDDVGVRAGEDSEVGDLVVVDAPESVITGRVVDPDGHALPGVLLQFQTPARSGWNGQRSDAEGRFHFVPPKGVAQNISARSPSNEWDHLQRIGVAPGTHDLELAFVPARWLAVVVVDDAGRPVANGKAFGMPASGSTAFPLPDCNARMAAIRSDHRSPSPIVTSWCSPPAMRATRPECLFAHSRTGSRRPPSRISRSMRLWFVAHASSAAPSIRRRGGTSPSPARDNARSRRTIDS